MMVMCATLNRAREIPGGKKDIALDVCYGDFFPDSTPIEQEASMK